MTATTPEEVDRQHHLHEHDDSGGRHGHDGCAARVGDQRIEVADVDAEVARLRRGPRAALLPVAESSEGRQLRRWVTQTLVTRALLERESEERGLTEGPPVEDVLPDRMAAVAVGGVLASVLRASGPARAVYADVVREVEVTAAEAAAYLDRSRPAHSHAPSCDAERAAARTRLTHARARQVFLDWLSARSARLVRLERGHEHPGDPHQPDATHRH